MFKFCIFRDGVYQRTLKEYRNFDKAILNFNDLFYNNISFFQKMSYGSNFYYSPDELLLVNIGNGKKEILKKFRLNTERYFKTYMHGNLSTIDILKQLFIENKKSTFCMMYKKRYIVLYDNNNFFKAILVKNAYEQKELYNHLMRCVMGLKLSNYLFLGHVAPIYKSEIEDSLSKIKKKHANIINNRR